MTTKKIVAITLLTNLVLLSVLFGILLFAGAAGATPAAQPSASAPTWCGFAAPADFEGLQNGQVYRNKGSTLESGDGRFVAPVDLPDGSTITKLELGGVDSSTKNISLVLSRLNYTTGDRSPVANVSSSGSSTSFNTWNTTTISNATIDNSTYTYFVKVDLTSTALKFVYAAVYC